jgi:hypothetical protein
MRRRRHLALLAVAILVASVGVYAGWTRFRSPELAAQMDPYRVWVALLKGANGSVYYVGSDNAHAYFRIGIIFSSYYKVPACAVLLPETFSVRDGRSYVVRFGVQTEEVILRGITRCPEKDGPFMWELERLGAP